MRPFMPRRSAAALVAAVAATVALSAQDAPAPTAVELLVAARRNALAERLATGADGRFVEQTPDRYLFVPLDRGLPNAEVTNSIQINQLALGLPLVVRGGLDQAGKLSVQRYELSGPHATFLPTAPTWIQSGARIEGAMQFFIDPRNAAAFRNTRGNSDAATRAASVVGNEMEQLVDEYGNATNVNDAAKAVEIARQWQRARSLTSSFVSSGSQYKAIYDQLDNYSPWRYSLINAQSSSTVAIAKDGAAICSGVVVAPDLVLTAAHCFAPDRQPAEVEVWFDYVDVQSGPPPALQRRAVEGFAGPARRYLPDLLDHKFSASLPDFALVRLKRNGTQPTLPANARPQCIRETPLARAEPVYVVGYPQGKRATVHDSARVYYPFRVADGADFARLRLDTEADFVDTPKHDEVMQEFDESYQTKRTEGVLTWRYFYHIAERGEPRMGIVADTFQGNSGGPVYDHERNQCVVGILNTGSSDTGERRKANWKQHEHVLPAGAILNHLRASPETAPLVGQMTLQQ